MKDEYLATGFADVDGRDDAAPYARCLDLLDSLPYYRDCKERSYELLKLGPGEHVLEVGSGLGDDAVRMARRVAPGGMVVGVDPSARMVEGARERAPGDLSVAFCRADARDLPFRDGRFTRARVDRTLQHIRDPEETLREMARVVAPGGILVAYDNDWGTFAVSGRSVEITAIVETLWKDSFTSPRIGRFLTGYFARVGLGSIAAYPSVSVITDLDLADRVYNLRQTVKHAVEARLITPVAGTGWLSELEAESREGRFFCTLTAFTVVGTKPAR